MVKNRDVLLIINHIHVALVKQGGNAVGSIRPFVVCLCVLSCLNHLTYDLDFGMGVDLDWAGIVGQRSRSHSN